MKSLPMLTRHEHSVSGLETKLPQFYQQQNTVVIVDPNTAITKTTGENELKKKGRRFTRNTNTCHTHVMALALPISCKKLQRALRYRAQAVRFYLWQGIAVAQATP